VENVVRISMSLDRELFAKFEELVRRSGYANRSEFIRDLLRSEIVHRQWQGNEIVVGTLTLVYDHHVHGLADMLTDVQHEHHGEILATTHVHLDHDICVEVTIMHGPARRLEQIADRLRQLRGVLHSTMCLSTTGREIH